MRGRKRPHSGNNRAKISAVSTVGGGASIIRKNKRVTHNATLTSVAASNDNDEVSLGLLHVNCAYLHISGKHYLHVQVQSRLVIHRKGFVID